MAGVVLRRFGAKSAAWQPSSLFTAGEWGWALDPTDLTKCWQTITGTTPVVSAGDPVGRLDDISGNAKHFAAAANDTTRPPWQTGGALYFDGANKLLRRAEAGLYAANGMTFACRVTGGNSAGLYCVAEGNSGDADPIYSILQSNAISGGYNRWFIRNNIATVILNADSGNAVWNNTWNTVIIYDSGGGFQLTLNGVAGGLASYVRSGTTTFNQTAIGGLWRTTIGSWWGGQIGRMLAIDRPLTAPETIDVTNWLEDGP